MIYSKILFLQNRLLKVNYCLILNYMKHNHVQSMCTQTKITPIKMSFREAVTKDPIKEKTNPIIIMHGLLGSKNNWNSLAKAIQNNTKKKVIVVDARNHGDSPHTDEFSYQHLAEDVKYFMNNEGIEKAHVIGHSMGGRAMMNVALAYPELISSLIVVDISPVGESPTMRHMSGLFDAMKSAQLDEYKSMQLPAVRRKVDQILSPVIEDAGVRQFILTNLKQMEDGSIKWQCNLDSLHKQFFNHMINFPPFANIKYSGHTYFIGGGKSDFIKTEDHPGIKKLFPTAEIDYIEGAGHWVHSQKPDIFLEKVTSFFNKILK